MCREAMAAAGPHLQVRTVKACSLDMAVSPCLERTGVRRGEVRPHFSQHRAHKASLKLPKTPPQLAMGQER